MSHYRLKMAVWISTDGELFLLQFRLGKQSNISFNCGVKNRLVCFLKFAATCLRQ
jgi:hypothetical protein